MAQLAIKGHATRGEEVIKMLELLGGKKDKFNTGKITNHIYFVNTYGHIESTSNSRVISNFKVLTLEELEAQMPYKIGDKVLYKNKVYEITGIDWHHYYDKITYSAKGETDNLALFGPEDFTLYKEEDMNNEITPTDVTTIRLIEEKQGTRILPAVGYELRTDGKGVIVVKKQPKYPKTYKECCELVNASPYVRLCYNISDGQTYSYDVDNLQIHENLRHLKICRDAYWKIAGDWKEKRKGKAAHYVIYSTLLDGAIKEATPNCIANYLLDFPTEEMRDTFYENFKDLIEKCKELL